MYLKFIMTVYGMCE